MTGLALHPIGEKTSPMHVALRLVAEACDGLVQDQEDERTALALALISQMLEGMESGLSTTLFEELSRRIARSGGGVSQRLGNSAVLSLAAWRMLQGDGQHKAANFAVEKSGKHVSSSAIRRALAGAFAGDVASIRNLAAWKEIERGWQFGKSRAGPRGEGESLESYYARVESGLIEGIEFAVGIAIEKSDLIDLFR